ncbi:hypothetical protein MMC31_006010 [Peltigera leucophlebia]|nr:hypothetical protein [Peltigera leucophlebia]
MASAFGSTKRDKRLIKRSTLISRIEKSKPKPSPQKRRRASKKLVTNLESLADALPDIPESRNGEMGLDDTTIIRHKSLKSKPGATKKKERLITMEKERFNKNMAQMMQSCLGNEEEKHSITVVDAKGRGRSKWAAIRGFIQQTMEQRPMMHQSQDTTRSKGVM